MTNKQIITATAMEAGIYSENEANKILKERGELPMHSLAGWQMRSPAGLTYRIRKGEHGLEAYLWKKKEPEKKENKEEKNKFKFYRAKTYLFTEKQVELVREESFDV